MLSKFRSMEGNTPACEAWGALQSVGGTAPGLPFLGHGICDREAGELAEPSSSAPRCVEMPVRWIVNEMGRSRAHSGFERSLLVPWLVVELCVLSGDAACRRFHTDFAQAHRGLRQALLPCVRDDACHDQCSVCHLRPYAALRWGPWGRRPLGRPTSTPNSTGGKAAQRGWRWE